MDLGDGSTYFLHEEIVQLLLAVPYAQPVGSVDYPDENIGLFKVVAPIGAKGLLATNVPLFS